MRVAATVLAALGAVSALTTPNPAHTFGKRQPVVTGTGCATVDVALPRTVEGICASPALAGRCNNALVTTALTTLLTTTLATTANPLVSLCLCTTAGVITGSSVADLRARLATDVGAINAVNNLLNGGLVPVLPASIDLAAILAPFAATQVVSQTSTCGYPSGSTPICSDRACAFACNGGTFLCEASSPPACIAVGEPCGSATTRRRRQVSNNLLCDAGRTACALPGNKFGFECLDTAADVESCGGCAFPLPGAKKGQDCTAIPNAADVSCVGGACVIDSCLKGYIVNGEACVSTVGGVIDEASEAVGGLASIVGKLSSKQFRSQARQVRSGALRVKAQDRK